MHRDILSLRRGTGVIYLISAVLHAAEMVFATLHTLGRIHVDLPPSAWKQIYYAHFLVLILGGILYLVLGFKKTGIFYYEVLADYLVGIAAFVVVFSYVIFALVAGRFNPWFSLIPSAFLAAYGLGLMQGRAFAVGPRLQPLP